MKENKGSLSVYMHARRHSWTSLRTKSRKQRWLRIALAAALLVGSLHFMRKHLIYRAALTLKYTPTTFPHIRTETEAALGDSSWQWEEADAPSSTPLPSSSFDRQDFLNHRSDWHRLGGGFEGEIFQYGDNVAKVFRKTNAPFRNCVPGASPELRWPTEISASLILGGITNGSRGSIEGDDERIDKDAIFLPVTDYFLAPKARGEQPRWHFLTPFLPLGGLGKLAKRLRHEDRPRTTRELDTLFRPSLERLLRGLDEMHTTHELCHDDVKLDNIFIASPRSDGPQAYEATHWMLGDLGNVREVDHPYHSSLVWLEKGRNLPDCRATDVLRLLKVYISFLRQSVRDTASFDKALFRGAEPWSALFWSVRHAAWGIGEMRLLSAASALDMSQAKYRTIDLPNMSGQIGPHIPELRSPWYRMLVGERRILAMATGKLLDVRTGEAMAKAWALAPILGTPSSPCEVATA